MKFIITILLTFFSLIYANRIEELALDAYKVKDYKTALKLYQQEAKKDNLKSILMIGVFLEKGLAIPKDKNRAIKIYKLLLKKVNLKKEKELNIAILATKRLFNLTHNEKFFKLYNKLLLVKNQTLNQNNIALNYYQEANSCNAAKIIDKKYKKGIEQIDCKFFEKFPDRMKNFMKLKYQRELAIKNKNKNKLYEISKKILKTTKPILKYIEQETLECYERANFISDIKKCDINYFTKSDSLLFTNRAKNIKALIAKNPQNRVKLDSYQKDKLINSLIYQFSIHNYEEEASYMVKLE